MTELEYGKYCPDYFYDPPKPEPLVPSFITDGFGKVIEPLERVTTNILNGWELFILAAVLLIVIMNKQMYPRQFAQVLSVFNGVSQTNQLLREWSPVRSFINFSHQLAFILVSSMFVQKSAVVLTYSNQYNTFLAYAIICAAMTMLLLLRYTITGSVEKMFGKHDVSDRQVAIDLASKTVLLFVMIPLQLILLYNPYHAFVMTGVVLIMVTFIVRTIYEFIDIRVFTRISTFYIFLYLCTLEIMPMAMAVAAVVRLLRNGSVI